MRRHRTHNPHHSQPSPQTARSASHVVIAGVFTLSGILGGVACDDEDRTGLVPVGGSGGDAGSAGSGGRAGGGSGGAQAGTGGSTAGTSGGGTGGSMQGDGGITREEIAAALCTHLNDVAASFVSVTDAGADAADASDAGTGATCAAPVDCAANAIVDMEVFGAGVPNCPELVDDYFSCVASAPLNAFQCNQDGLVEHIFGEPTCADEENSLFLAPPENCL